MSVKGSKLFTDSTLFHSYEPSNMMKLVLLSDECPNNKKEGVSADFPRFPLVTFAETSVSKPRNNQSETHSTIDHPFQKLVDPPAERKDENASRTSGSEAKLNPALRFITHHFERGEIR
jgi:hypothetical protein